MNKIKCLYALSSTCRGTVAQRGHTLRSYSQPVNPNCFPSSWGPSDMRQSQVVPPLHKNQIRLLPSKMPGERYPWQQSTCAGWGARVLYFFSSLRVNGDNFTATASHQEDPVQTLHENLQELHVWEDSSQGVKHAETSTLHSKEHSLHIHSCPSQRAFTALHIKMNWNGNN